MMEYRLKPLLEFVDRVNQRGFPPDTDGVMFVAIPRLRRVIPAMITGGSWDSGAVTLTLMCGPGQFLEAIPAAYVFDTREEAEAAMAADAETK